MRKEITYSQKRAIIIGKELAEQITTNSQLAEVFLEKIKNIPADKKYADIIKEVLPRHKKIKTLSCKTLRSIAQNALKTLLSDKERKEIITKSRQRGGRNSVAKLQKEKGIKVLDPREKNLLNDIGRNPGEYKKNTVRDIAKIQKELKEKL